MNTPIILATVFFSALLMLALIRFFQTRSKARKDKVIGLNVLNLLVSLIKLTQQHRGMHSGFLNGQASMAEKLRDNEQEIGLLWKELHTYRDRINSRSYSYLHQELQQWHKIVNQADSNANLSFRAHSGLVARLLDSLWDIADDFALTTSSNEKVQQLSNLLIKTLPELAESIGQVRALTMQVSNSDRCAPDKKLQLIYTLASIDQNMEKARKELSQKNYTDLKVFVEDVRNSVNDMSLAERNPDDFFKQATGHIDSIFVQIQTGLRSIRRELGVD